MIFILKICFISQFKNSNFMTFSDKLKVPPVIIYRSSVAISMEQVDDRYDELTGLKKEAFELLIKYPSRDPTAYFMGEVVQHMDRQLQDYKTREQDYKKREEMNEKENVENLKYYSAFSMKMYELNKRIKIRVFIPDVRRVYLQTHCMKPKSLH